MTTPVLSASIAHALVSQSPAHAWTEHPDLNPAYQAEESETFDLGTAAHAYLLQGEGETQFALIEAPDWRTKAAREARDAARAEGKTPLLTHRWAAVQAMAKAARRQLAAHEAPIPLTQGIPEETLYWKDPSSGVYCRSTPDWLHTDRRTIDDYKTTGASAHPAIWSKVLFTSGAAMQAGFYRRAVQVVYNVEADFRFVVQENYPPYALSVISLDPEALVYAEALVTEAAHLWAECCAANHWPAYPTRVCYAEVPPWVVAAWQTRTYYQEVTP